MAIRTAAQRYAMLNFGDGNTLHLLPEPDNSIGIADRLHLLDLSNLVLPGWTEVGGVSHNWTEVPTDDSETWIEVSGVSHNWSEVDTDDSDTWTEVGGVSTTWTEVPD